jgi:hypothetical protein
MVRIILSFKRVYSKFNNYSTESAETTWQCDIQARHFQLTDALRNHAEWNSFFGQGLS